MALEAALTLATDIHKVDIVRRMDVASVNLHQATSMVGQGPHRDDEFVVTHLITTDDRERKT